MNKHWTETWNAVQGLSHFMDKTTKASTEQLLRTVKEHYEQADAVIKGNRELQEQNKALKVENHARGLALKELEGVLREARDRAEKAEKELAALRIEQARKGRR